MIEVKGLTKSFNDVKAVDSIGFSIEKGEVVGLLGPNGAGKTTTMRMMTGYLMADSGDAVIAGNSIAKDPERVKQQIGYLPENAPLYEDMVVEDYLYFMGRARGVAEDALPAAVERMVDACSLRTHLKKNISQLSKGYKQRVGLAATIIHDPQVLILDEPTTGLDPNQIAEIRRLILEIGKEKTVILSTHIMQEVQETCNRVIIISNGRIVADDQVKTITEARQAQLSLSMTVQGDSDISSDLNGQDWIIKSEILQSEPGSRSYKVFSSEHIGARLFNLAKEKGWTLSEMSTHKQNLESVFRELTQNAGAK